MFILYILQDMHKIRMFKMLVIATPKEEADEDPRLYEKQAALINELADMVSQFHSSFCLAKESTFCNFGFYFLHLRCLKTNWLQWAQMNL